MASKPGFIVARAAPEDAKANYATWVLGVMRHIDERDWAAAVAVIRSQHQEWLAHFPYTIYAAQMIEDYAQRFSQLGAWKLDAGTYEEALITACRHPAGPRPGAMRCLIDLGMLYKHLHRFEDAARLHYAARNLDPAAYVAAGGPEKPGAV